MARALNKLTDTACKAASKPGRYGDGGGLYLLVGPSGGKSFAFVWTVTSTRDGKPVRKWREMGLGAYPVVKLAAARRMAAECREAVAHGRDPIADRNREDEPTFAQCATKFLASMEGQWRNDKHRAQWRMTLTEYARPLSAMRVSTIGTDDVLSVLSPLWQKRPETASRLRGRIERVLDYAKARGWRTGENPALWRGHLKNILPVRQRLTRGHHKALPYADAPAFIQRLREHDALSARALEFLILTAARSGEVMNATWKEFDLEAALWTVPASRMKTGKEHRVPLSDQALAIVKELNEARHSNFVFPGLREDKPLSSMAFAMLLRRMKIDVTPHGFRSTFRDWAGDATHFPRDLAEQALSHRVGDATELAYRRSDAVQKRRALMQAWAAYLDAPVVDNVVHLPRAS